VSRVRVTLVTCPNPRLGERIAKALVGERLAACVNVVRGLTSVYRWKGKVCRDRECVLVIKSRASLSKRIEKRVKELHSYTVPEVIQVPVVSGSAEYLAWLERETR
jgi:periplasmic divalent cation tolerance protein